MSDVVQPRRSRDRARTEANLLEATFELLERDGIFNGLNLQEVADRSGVNRGQIYQYFGDRRSLLRAAVASQARAWAASAQRHWELSFTQRRRAIFRSALANPRTTLVEALLSIDGDPDYHVLPEIDKTKEALRRDVEVGDLPPGSDAIAMHAFMVAAYKGYIVFREALARDVGVSVDEMDARILTIYDRVVDEMASRPDS